MSDNWHEDVYGRESDNASFTRREWKAIRKAIIKRDHRICARCDARFDDSKLSVHHIVSRAYGGSNDETNLITLCNPCHDYVEINDLRTLADIAGSFETDADERELETEDATDINRPVWHKWVYGGQKKRF